MRTHTKTRSLALAAAGAALLAAPVALAAPAAEPGPFAAGKAALSPVPEVVTPDERRAKARARALARERRERREGPFHPLVGKPDYGGADAAFGAARSGHVHAGQDVFAPAGTPLVAVADAVVADAGTDAGQGNYLHLHDPERGRTYVYMHMVAPAEVRTGDRVEAGERVGAVGCTGSCWGDHLHFEIHSGRGIGGEAADPLPALRRWDSIERPR
jgi:murein DD-endopeptidase MepM/ murein hydrolase activator NlpD